MPAVIVECGFLSNKEEEARLMQEDYRREVAESIVLGIMDWHALEMEKPAPLAAVDRSNEPADGT